MADRKITDLTELTAPAADDLLPIVDSSEATAANKNKKIQYGTFLRNLPSGTVGAPSLAWTADTGVTGIYRSAANELAFTTNSTFAGKFSTTGFQLGTGTAAAQLHLFSSDTTDQVIIENTDAGLDTAPDVVLYRNSASPANNDNLGNIEFRGKDSGGNNHAYAQILSTIGTVTDTAEVGILDLMTANASAPAMRLRLRGENVGISEATPLFPLHVSSTITGTGLQVQSTNNDSASGADITLYRRRGAATVGQNGDLLSTVYFRGHNDNATTEQVDYAAVEGSIVSVTNNSENGQLSFKVQKSGTLTTQLAITNANVILSARPILPTASPASTATGVTGEITWDNGYFYVCTATNTWKKVGISTDGVPGSTSAFSSGSAASPSITFADDTNTGIFNPAADAVGISTGGTERLRVDSTGQIEAVSLGTAAAPVYSFTTDPDTGIYSPGANQLAISTNGTGRLFVDASGRVGVGTASPSSLLNLAHPTVSDIRLTVAGNLVGNIYGSSSDLNVHAVANVPLIFATNNTERARIDSSGRLLIGTSTTISTVINAGLQVQGTGANAYISSGRWSADANRSELIFNKSRGASVGTRAIVQSGDGLGGIAFTGDDGTNFVIAAQISGLVDGTPGTNDMPGRLVFSTTADGASSPTERMRITNGGKILLGCINDPSTSIKGFGYIGSDANPYVVTSAGATTTTYSHYYFVNGNGTVGSIATNGSATAYNTSSDYRLKENIVPLTGAIDRINQLQVHRFNFIADPDTTVDGFIAHEAQAVVPECVTGTKDEVDDEGNPVYQGIDQSKLVPLLTAALQEALAKIETLEARLTAAGI